MTSSPEKRRVYRNVVVISASFLFLFTAFQSVALLQSSLNKVQVCNFFILNFFYFALSIKADGLGSLSLAVVYIALVLSCMLLPTYVLSRLGAKWTMVAAMASYSLYMAAQFYPSFYTLVPTAAIMGTWAAPLWIAKSTYLSKVLNLSNYFS